MPSKFVTDLFAKAFRYSDRAGGIEIEDRKGNILGYKPYVVKASPDGLSEEHLNKVYVEELENQRFDTEKEASEYARNFLFALRAKTASEDTDK